MQKNKDKSLFLYTALIFFVAIILIILAFFGQTNVQRSQLPPQEPDVTQTPVTGITEKASVLSEENARLIQEVISLKEEITKRDEEIEGLNAQIELRNIQDDNDKLLFHAYSAKLAGNEDDYAVIMNNINYDSLTPEQKTIYDELNK